MLLGEMIKQLQKLELKYGSNVVIISSYNEGYIDEVNEILPGVMSNDNFGDISFSGNIKNSEVNSIYIG